MDIEKYNLTEEQKEVFEALVGHKNIFLTGEAGTGKSYVVTKYNEYCVENKIKLIKLAPTGIAANRIEGATIHSQFDLPLGVLIQEPYKYPEILKSVEVVLIDEISMVRLDLFDYIMKQIELANRDRPKQIQIILVGDFFQLPPVLPKADKDILNDVYKCDIGKGYAFQSRMWNTLNFKTYILKHVIRQSDESFCKVLTEARYGSSSSVDYIESNCRKKPIKDAIWVAGKNSTVADINKNRLSKIEAKEYSITTITEGEIKSTDYPCDDIFTFKVGARVMALVNDRDGLYNNGSIGEIIAYSRNKRIEKNDFDYEDLEDTITVKFDNGNTSEIGLYTFENCIYVTDDENEYKKGSIKDKTLTRKVIGTATNFPLKLAYAITVHKSQGQTFEAMNFLPEIFDDGQFYVAVSRCKTLENMFIYGSVNKSRVKANEEALSFYKDSASYNFFERNFVRVEIAKDKYENMFKYLNENDAFYEKMMKWFRMEKRNFIKEPEQLELNDFN